jgi:hypothetical protein
MLNNGLIISDVGPTYSAPSFRHLQPHGEIATSLAPRRAQDVALYQSAGHHRSLAMNPSGMIVALLP